MGEREHFVQFYECDSFLISSVSDFMAAGLRAHEGAIALATKPHRDALTRRLCEAGFDLDSLGRRGQCFILDAEETLGMFMIDGLPDAALFRETVGGIIDQLGRGGHRVRAFGEMVAVLFEQGNSAGANRLEELWNDLGKTRRFSLFCAYPMAGFGGQTNRDPFVQICNHHSRVIPAESYAAQPDADERLRAISLLQQKASSLESEIVSRKKAEGALRAEKGKLAVAVALAQLGIWEWDIETNRLSCSDELKAIFGFAARDQVTFKDLLATVHLDDRDRVETVFREAATNAGDFSTEYRVVDAEGGVRWIASMGRCFCSGAHRVVGVMADISERRRASEILEQTVAARTSKLNEAIGELESFSYSVSHDLRAPLRSMQGYATLLIQEFGAKLDSEGCAYLERISASANRMEQLIRDVLNLSRVSCSRLNLQLIGLDHFLHELLDTDPNCHLPDAKISIESPLPYVMGNATALTQCFSNLLGNAVKFVAPGVQPRVRIWAENLTPPSAEGVARHVRIFIQDNGIGIQSDAQERIFAAFQRVSREYEGSGVGLAIVKKAVERMGGRVGIQSEIGKGSTFWLDLIEGGK